MKNLVAATIFAITLAGLIWVTLFRPNNYEDCILNSMKDVTNNRAADYIAISCEKKFPVKSYR